MKHNIAQKLDLTEVGDTDYIRKIRRVDSQDLYVLHTLCILCDA